MRRLLERGVNRILKTAEASLMGPQTLACEGVQLESKDNSDEMPLFYDAKSERT